MQVVNALAKIESKFLRIDVDKWANVILLDKDIEANENLVNISAIEYE